MLKLSGYSRLTWGRGREMHRARALAGRGTKDKVPHEASLDQRKPTPAFGNHRSSRRIDGPRAHFSRPPHLRTRTAIYAPRGGGQFWSATPKQTCPWPRPRAQLAFKDLMIHGILQFTLSIAFRYILHRGESRDIRCRES
jgi:hypothetical protein